MTERLSVELVTEYNEVLCSDTGEHSALLDPDGLAAAVERPWSGFGDEEFFPTLYDKAAALLHGIASRQVFENGNKRTAWAASVALLDLNGIDIGAVEVVHSDMFVRAAALDHSLEIPDIAEWFTVTHRQAKAPSLRATRWGIERLGVVGLNEHGVPVADHFRMISPGPSPETSIFAVDGNLSGWTAEELHIVLHGNPCVVGPTECRVAAVLAGRS